MSCDHELANEWVRYSGRNASYITNLIFNFPTLSVWIMTVTMKQLETQVKHTKKEQAVSTLLCKNLKRKRIKCVPSTLRNLKTQQSPIILDLLLRKTLFLKCSPSTRKRKVGVFKFLWFQERFRKGEFS